MSCLLGDIPTSPEVSGYSRGQEDCKVATVTPKILPKSWPKSHRLINDTSVLYI